MNVRLKRTTVGSMKERLNKEMIIRSKGIFDICVVINTPNILSSATYVFYSQPFSTMICIDLIITEVTNSLFTVTIRFIVFTYSTVSLPVSCEIFLVPTTTTNIKSTKLEKLDIT